MPGSKLHQPLPEGDEPIYDTDFDGVDRSPSERLRYNSMEIRGEQHLASMQSNAGLIGVFAKNFGNATALAVILVLFALGVCGGGYFLYRIYSQAQTATAIALQQSQDQATEALKTSREQAAEALKLAREDREKSEERNRARAERAIVHADTAVEKLVAEMQAASERQNAELRKIVADNKAATDELIKAAKKITTPTPKAMGPSSVAPDGSESIAPFPREVV